MERFEVSDGIYLTNDYALFLDESRTIIIADLHLGYEGAMQSEGISFPKYQKEVMVNRLENIVRKFRPERIVVNGDFKHEFSKNLRQEWREVEEVLNFLLERVDVILVRGNHDNFLMTIVSAKGVTFENHITIDGITLTHGHKEFRKDEDILVIGHEHPSLKLRDEIGASIKLPCFLFHETERIIVLPAFSPLASGTDVTTTMQKDFLSPMLQNVDVDDLRIFALTEIGLLEFGRLRGIIRAL